MRAGRCTGGTDDSVVTLGRTASRTSSASPHGILGGSAFGINATAADGSALLGRQLDVSLPCQGTSGRVRTSSLAKLDQPKLNGLALGVLQDRVYGDQTGSGVTGWTQASIARLELGSDLQVTGIVARATITRGTGGVLRRVATHHVGSITSHGKRYTVPAPGKALVIPGVARIEIPPSVRTASGVQAAGLRITLLSGSAAQSVINLAVARAESPE